MRVQPINPFSLNPFCVFGVADTEKGRAIEEEMRAWLEPNYNVVEVWHDGLLFEQPALRYMQDMCAVSKRPCLYIHTKGAFNRDEFSEKVREMWMREFTEKRDLYFGLVDRPYAAVACPMTGKDKTTWYNGFVVNAQAMAEIPVIEPLFNRKHYERLFVDKNPQVIGVMRNDVHRKAGEIDAKLLATLKQYV